MVSCMYYSCATTHYPCIHTWRCCIGTARLPAPFSPARAARRAAGALPLVPLSARRPGPPAVSCPPPRPCARPDAKQRLGEKTGEAVRPACAVSSADSLASLLPSGLRHASSPTARPALLSRGPAGSPARSGVDSAGSLLGARRGGRPRLRLGRVICTALHLDGPRPRLARGYVHV
jgi:hypothetical protein